MNFFACHCRTFTYRNKRIEKHRGRQLVVNRVHLCFNWTCGTYTDTNSNNRSNAKWIIFKHYFFEKKTPPDLVCEVKSRTVFLPLNGAKERERAVARRGIGIWCTRAKNTKPLSCRKSFAEILPRQWHCYGEQWGDSAKNRILSLSLSILLSLALYLYVCVCVCCGCAIIVVGTHWYLKWYSNYIVDECTMQRALQVPEYLVIKPGAVACCT